MNLLNSFMTCVNPDQISPTNSIESINQEHRFITANIDEQGNDISRGEIHITNEAIVYKIADKSPISWPLIGIRRYGCIDNGQKLIFEAGRKCGTGQGIYAFRLYRASECVAIMNEKINSKDSELSQLKVNSPTTRKPIATRTRQRKDASTSTDGEQRQASTPSSASGTYMDGSVKPLSYVLIDFETTKILNESAQDHAAMRIK